MTYFLLAIWSDDLICKTGEWEYAVRGRSVAGGFWFLRTAYGLYPHETVDDWSFTTLLEEDTTITFMCESPVEMLEYLKDFRPKLAAAFARVI